MADELDAAAPPVATFKKPARKANIRKREREDEDEDGGGEGGGAKTTSLGLMRELQRQRQRAKGVTLEVKNSSGEAGGEEGEEDGAADHGLESTFTAQTEGGEADPNMLKYIEEQMRREQLDSAAGGAGAAANDEDGLFSTPDFLKGRVIAERAAAENEDAGRWLAGIMEVSLPAEDKIATIEETEAAKRRMMAAKLSSQGRGQSTMVIPGNFNANFHSHRREFAEVRKATAQSKGRDGTAGAAAAAASGMQVASDQGAIERFRRNEAHKRR